MGASANADSKLDTDDRPVRHKPDERPNEVSIVGKTVFATAARQLGRIMVIAGVSITLGVTAVPTQAARPATSPDIAHGQSSWSGASFGLIMSHKTGHKLVA